MKHTRYFPLTRWALQTIPVLSNSSILLVIQRSLAIVLPIIILGAFALIIRHFPFPGWLGWLDSIFGQGWRLLLDSLIAGTLGIVSLAVLCTFSGAMAMAINQKRKGPFISPVMAIVVVLSCFIVITAPEAVGSWSAIFSIKHGLLPALIIGCLACGLFFHFSRYRFLQWPMGAVGHDPVVRDVLTVLPAGIITVLMFFVFRCILLSLDITDLHHDIRNLLYMPFAGSDNTLGFALAYNGLSQLLWFCGAHGPNLLFPVEENILSPAILANGAAIAQGHLPEFIFTKAFFDVFTRMGGSGSTLCLIIAIVLKSHDRGARKLCIFALLPALCNVNEPLLFGLPVVLNPCYLVPFLLLPLIQTVTTYVATLVGWLPFTVENINWTTPVFASGFIATGSIAGAMMQAFNLLIGVLLYIPFVRLVDELREQRGMSLLHKLMDAATDTKTTIRETKVIDLAGENGRFAKNLGSDLESALKLDQQLYLEYQPQIRSVEQSVYGVEALLRWRHPIYGMVPPPVSVALAEDLGIIDRLGLFVLAEACRQRAAWKDLVDESFCMSVNVAPCQLTYPGFSEAVFATLREYELKPAMLELEITESTVVDPDDNTMAALRNLQKEGVRIAIDDFGMGHASLRYLRSFPVSTVKIDRSFTSGEAGQANDHIVRSVIELGNTLGIDTIIEGVETREQLDRFCDIGCRQFQGYLFSRPLPSEECMQFIRQWKSLT